MQDRPTFAELLEAVREFMEVEVAAHQTDQRARFRTLVAINALSILGRELELELELVREEASQLLRLLGRQDGLPDEPDHLRSLVLGLNAELAARIRAGDVPPGALEHLRNTAAAKLKVASPGYLARYEG